MKLILVADDGTVVDSVEVERDDLVTAQNSAVGALALLNELNLNAS